jgi:steroid 5-alpha reductase family enzyme
MEQEILQLIIYSLGISILIQAVFFAFAASFKTDKVTDLSYGLTFIILAFYLLIKSGDYSLSHLVTAAMVTAWAVRLATYLFIRILKTKRDKRFDGIRENTKKFAQFWFLQAITVWVVMLPTTALIGSGGQSSLSWIMLLGAAVWAVGLAIETIADYQKYAFKSREENKGRFIASGLWSWSRHPNYFGEMLCWWGIFIYTVPVLSGWLWLAIAGPLFITFILLFVSGIPPLEKYADERFGNDPNYKDYKSRTSLLVPLPPHRR